MGAAGSRETTVSDGLKAQAFILEIQIALEKTAHGNLKLWDVASGKELDALNGLMKTGEHCIGQFTPDGKTLITTRHNPGNTITLWDVSAGKELRTLKLDRADWIIMALTADGRILASSGNQEGHNKHHDVKLWDLATGKELASLPLHDTQIGSLAFSADGKMLAAGGGVGRKGEGQVQLWDVSGVFSGKGK